MAQGPRPDRRRRSFTEHDVTAIDRNGRRVDLSKAEDRAFWTWAIVEVLRHTGVRIEELLELTHLSLRPFRKPDGQIIPLLQIAPSKSDVERVLPVGPELAHVCPASCYASRKPRRTQTRGRRIHPRCRWYPGGTGMNACTPLP